MTEFHLACLFIGILLLASSGLILILCRIRPQNETFKKVKTIIGSWWFITLPFLLALSFQKWGMILLFYTLSCYIIVEYFKVSKVKYKKYATYALISLSTLQYLALALESQILFFVTIPVLCLWLIPGLVIFKATIIDLELVFSALFGNAFVIYYFSHLPAITAMPEKLGLSSGQACLSILILTLLTWGNDIFQFLSGKTFGKRKIVPDVSPNKTLAGFVGGIICTIIVAIFTLKPALDLNWPMTLALGALVSIAGMFGDLFFSAVKRKIGVKDFGKILPGHGGLLDRVDSLIFTAPLFYHFLFLSHQGVL